MSRSRKHLSRRSKLTNVGRPNHNLRMFKPGGLLRCLGAAAALLCLLAPSQASAGRRPFLFAYDSEIVPEGDVELEQWVWAESRPANSNRSALYWIWWGPVFGLTNHLEMALPFQVIASQGNTSLQNLFADFSYRFFPREQEGGFQPLVRVSIRQAISRGARPSSIEANLVGSYGRTNALHLTGNLGLDVSLPWPENLPRPITGSYALGVAYPILGNELRLSAEFRGEVGINDTSPTSYPRHSVGGALAWSRGRVWITAGSLFGLTGLSSNTPRFTPRLIWAVAF